MRNLSLLNMKQTLNDKYVRKSIKLKIMLVRTIYNNGWQIKEVCGRMCKSLSIQEIENKKTPVAVNRDPPKELITYNRHCVSINI